MKRKMFLGIAALAVAVVSGYNVYLSKPSTKGLSDLALANVEALADDETNIKYMDCTRATSFRNCKNSEGRWTGISIKTVEEYKVAVGSPEVCKHDRVTKCPSGSYEF